MHSFADALVRAVNQQCTFLLNTSPTTKKANDQSFASARGHELARAAEQGPAYSCADTSGWHWAPQLPPGWLVERGAFLSILLQKPLGLGSFRSKRPPFLSPARARSNGSTWSRSSLLKAGRAQLQSGTLPKRFKTKHLSRQEAAWQVLHGFFSLLWVTFSSLL